MEHKIALSAGILVRAMILFFSEAVDDVSDELGFGWPGSLRLGQTRQFIGFAPSAEVIDAVRLLTAVHADNVACSSQNPLLARYVFLPDILIC